MTLAKVISGTVFGVDAYSVEVEVNAGGGEPKVVLGGIKVYGIENLRQGADFLLGDRSY